METYFPYHIDGRGRTKEAMNSPVRNEYIHGLIEQLLFTAPGERVMRPNFGGALQQLIFAENTASLGATTEMLVSSALQQWLGHLIFVDSVRVESLEAKLQVEVNYRLLASGTPYQATFNREFNQ